MRKLCACLGITVAVLATAALASAAQQITSLAAGSPGTIRVPVAITVEGDRSCAFKVDFGDGRTLDFAAPLPQRLTHTYERVGTYTVVATAAAPCTGTMTLPLEVTDQASLRRLTGVKVSTNIEHGTTNAVTTIVVLGSGTCTYTIDFGDGTQSRRTESLPDLVRHTFTAAKDYTITATAQAPCEGVARGGVGVRSGESPGISRLDITLDPTAAGRVSLAIAGHGRCGVTVNWGDSAEEMTALTLPGRVTHQYTQSGRYEIRVKAATPCTGEASVALTVPR